MIGCPFRLIEHNNHRFYPYYFQECNLNFVDKCSSTDFEMDFSCLDTVSYFDVKYSCLDFHIDC